MTVCNKAALSIPKESSDWPEGGQKDKSQSQVRCESFDVLSELLRYAQRTADLYPHPSDCYFWHAGKCLFRLYRLQCTTSINNPVLKPLFLCWKSRSVGGQSLSGVSGFQHCCFRRTSAYGEQVDMVYKCISSSIYQNHSMVFPLLKKLNLKSQYESVLETMTCWPGASQTDYEFMELLSRSKCVLFVIAIVFKRCFCFFNSQKC